MAPKPKPPSGPKPVEAFLHDATRRNIPTAELQSLAQQVEELDPVGPVHYARSRPARRARATRTGTRKWCGTACA